MHERKDVWSDSQLFTLATKVMPLIEKRNLRRKKFTFIFWAFDFKVLMKQQIKGAK